MPFERFETETPVSDLETTLNGILEELEKQGMTGANGDPEICIILRNNIQGDDGFRMTTAITYIGATPQEVADDLKTRQ